MREQRRDGGRGRRGMHKLTGKGINSERKTRSRGGERDSKRGKQN